MKEYWVNVYDCIHYNDLGRKWPNRGECLGRTRHYMDRPLSYRLHVKMKDKPGMSRSYYWTYSSWKSMGGEQWTPEQLEDMNDFMKHNKFVRASDKLNWMD